MTTTVYEIQVIDGQKVLTSKMVNVENDYELMKYSLDKFEREAYKEVEETLK